MALKKIVNFRTTSQEKQLMLREAKRRGVTLSVFLCQLWDEDKKRRDDLHRKKNYVRTVTHRLIRQGLIKKTPCVDCGSKDVEAHHEDYDNPYRVVFLCKKDHRKRHPSKKKGARHV